MLLNTLIDTDFATDATSNVVKPNNMYEPYLEYVSKTAIDFH